MEGKATEIDGVVQAGKKGKADMLQRVEICRNDSLGGITVSPR